MNNKEYTVYFENGQELTIFGIFDNEEHVESNEDFAIFIEEISDEESRSYMIPMSKVLYIKCKDIMM